MEACAAGHFTKFERFLGKQEFTAGSVPTAGDFPLWEMLDQVLLTARPAPSGLSSCVRTSVCACVRACVLSSVCVCAYVRMCVCAYGRTFVCACSI
jgi:hypothetical protein